MRNLFLGGKRHGQRRSRVLRSELLEPRQLLAATDVVISELLYHPAPTNTGGEFIELFNRGETPVNLSGWQLSDGVDYGFPQGTSLGAGQYLVIYGDPAAVAFYGLTGALGPFQRSLDNAGERVELRANDNSVIDTVQYDDDAPWPVEADGSGASLELINPALDNSAAASWGVGQPYSPGRANRPDVNGPAGDIVITEIMYAPEMSRYVLPIDPIANQARWEDGDDPRGEYLELYNRGTLPVDLSGGRIVDGGGVLYEFASGVQLAAGQYLVVAADSTAIQSRYGVTNVVGNFAVGRTLSNNGESLTLADRTGQLIDFVRYGDSEAWPVSPDQMGVSLELIDPLSDNRQPNNWRGAQVPAAALPTRPPVGTEFYVTRGTPGTANSVTAIGLPPFVARNELQHTPAKPASNDTITISARVTSAHPITEVTLLVDTLVAPYQSPTASTLVMRDDGQGGDLVAGDGQYTVQLPPLNSQTLVRYRVRVVDTTGRLAVFPDATEPNPNQAFFVYDGEAETNLNAYFLIIPTATQQALDANIWTSDFHDATLVIDGVVYDHLGIHYRGRGWRGHPKKSYAVAFNKGEYLRGLSRLDLAMHFPTMQHLTHQLLASVGVQPLGSEPVRVYRNGTFSGLMLAQDSPNSAWLETQGLDSDGEVFKASAAPNYSPAGFSGNIMADLDYFADTSLYPRLYEKKGDAFGSYESIIGLTNLIANTPDDQIYQKLTETIDLDAWLASWAVNVAGGNGDIIGTNFTVVKPAEPGSLWQLKSFDFSHFFGCQMLDFVDVICNPFTQDPYRYFNHFHFRVMNNAQLKNRFLVILKDVLENQLTSERINRLVDQTFQDYEVDRLEEVALNIPGPPTHYVVFGSDQQEIKDYHAKRREWLLNTWIPSQGIQMPTNSHPTIRLERPEIAPNATTIRWSHQDAEGDPATVDLYWTDGKWLSFQPIEGAQQLNAATGSFVWQNPPGIVNDEIFIQAVIRDNQSDLVGRDMSSRPAPPAPPTLNVTLGEPTTLTIVNPNPIGTIYFTLDGSDPKTLDNQVSPTALIYSGPVIITENSRVKARISAPREIGTGVSWSDVAETFIAIEIPTLAITEVMYNPAGGTEFEFIEFFHRGQRPIRLNGIVADGRGNIFDFSQSNIAVLQPGEYMVLVKNLARFRERYDSAEIKIAGVFDQSLSNTSQNINLTLEPMPEPFLSVRYQDTWHPSTDGNGRSLVLVDPNSPAETWSTAAAWRTSLRPNGSPGGADIEDADLNNDQVVNILDVDLLCARIAQGDLLYDFSQDGHINEHDLLHVIRHVLNTSPGDANLDGQFDSADLVRIFQPGHYEDSLPKNSSWATGDWNCDGEFNTSDLVLAFQSGAYIAGAHPIALASVQDAAAALALSFFSPPREEPDSQDESPFVFRLAISDGPIPAADHSNSVEGTASGHQTLFELDEKHRRFRAPHRYDLDEADDESGKSKVV